MVGHVVSPFNLYRTLPVGGGLLVPCSCRKTTHANGYYGAWPGWVVSISMLPLTVPPKGGISQISQNMKTFN